MNIDKAYFDKESDKFQEMMGLRTYTVEQISKALRGLMVVYLNLQNNPDVSQKDKDSAEHRMDMITVEHDKRLALRLSHGL
jgi:hypothetical protein